MFSVEEVQQLCRSVDFPEHRVTVGVDGETYLYWFSGGDRVGYFVFGDGAVVAMLSDRAVHTIDGHSITTEQELVDAINKIKEFV